MKNLLIFLTVLWLAGCKNAPAQSPPVSPAPSPGVRQLLVVNSPLMPQSDTSYVFLPAGYAQNKQNYPLVYMLHGWTGNYKQWSNIINLQEYADRYRFIIVCPDGTSDSWYLNSPLLPNSQFESFFFKDLAPRIQKDFRVDTANVFITGLSMGGHGALMLFLKNPAFFRAAASTSGLMDLRWGPGRYGLPKILGPYNNNDKYWLSYSVIGNLPLLLDKNKQFLFDCGTEDPFYEGNKDLHRLCDAYKIKATFIAQPGKHEKAYWQKAIPAHFAFFSQLIN